MADRNPFEDFLGGFSNLFGALCEPQNCAPRAVQYDNGVAGGTDRPSANDWRFRELVSDDGIQVGRVGGRVTRMLLAR